MKILVKDKVIKNWKPKMEVSDFYILNDKKRYTLNKIVDQKISQENNLAKITIEYYDSKDNFIKNQDIEFAFEKDKEATLKELFRNYDFVFNEEKLNSLNFINFNENDVKISKPNLTVKKLTIKDWLIFDEKINFKIDFLFYNEFTYSLTIEKKFKIDYPFLIKKLLNDDAKNSFLRINSYLEFEVEEFSAVIQGYKDFFWPSEYKKLFKIIDEIEIINPRILTNKIDIFSPEAVDYFNASIIIDRNYIKNFVFKARYNANDLKKFITEKFMEFPIRKLILGAPRNNIKINDIYRDFKKAYFNSILKDIGIPNVIEDNIYIKMNNFNFSENSSTIEIYFKNDHKKWIIRKKMKFEDTIIESVGDGFLKNNLILVNDNSIFKKFPDQNLILKDFSVQGSKSIEILDVGINKKTPIQSKWISYKFKLVKHNDEDLIFDYVQDFYFQNSKIEYFLKNIKIEDLNINYFQNQSDEYFYKLTLKNKFDQNNIVISNAVELKKIIISNKYEKTDFKIVSLKFNKNDIFESTIPISLTIRSNILKSTKTLYTSFQLKNRILYNKFNFLSGDDIRFTSKKLIHSFPIPILDISDFYVQKPFFIFDVTSKYNNDNMSVLCSFIIKFRNKMKLVEKEIYFDSKMRKVFAPDKYKLNLKLFKSINKKNILVKYNKNQTDYFIKPKVNLILPSDEFYAKIIDWKLKWRFTKAVVLYIEIKYCDMIKRVRKKITYANKVNKNNFKAWKEASYE